MLDAFSVGVSLPLPSSLVNTIKTLAFGFLTVLVELKILECAAVFLGKSFFYG